MSALMSPSLFRKFVSRTSRRLCEGYPFTMIHLHPSSFIHMEDILSNQMLGMVEINKDAGGPTVTQMSLQFQQVVAAGKKLLVWGDLDEEDLDAICSVVPKNSVYFNIVAPAEDRAAGLMEYLIKRY
jgi:hypothetical protein